MPTSPLKLCVYVTPSSVQHANTMEEKSNRVDAQLELRAPNITAEPERLNVTQMEERRAASLQPETRPQHSHPYL